MNVSLRRGSVFRDLAEGGFAAAGLHLEPAFEADYVGSLIGLADAGLGGAIVPGYATALTDRGRIRWKRLERPVVEREVTMVRRVGPSLSPAAQALAEFIVARVPHARGRDAPPSPPPAPAPPPAVGARRGRRLPGARP